MKKIKNLLFAALLPLVLNNCDHQKAHLQEKKIEIENILADSWQHYKEYKIGSEGRPYCDRDNEDIDGDKDKKEFQTVSEGPSYVLLRAVYAEDSEAFEKTWDWTKKNLQRNNIKEVYQWSEHSWKTASELKLPQDHLFAWRQHEDIENTGRSGVIYYTFEENQLWRDGFDDASDASQDIAAALILAGKKWGKDYYLEEARNILKDIWKNEVKEINGKNYLLGGDKFHEINGINLSYFRPFYYEVLFPEIDPGHPWKSLIETSYEAIAKCSGIVENKTNLPPNWCALNEKSGLFTENPWFKGEKGNTFGWDAFRTLYWVAQHYLETKNNLAREFLAGEKGPYSFLSNKLAEKGELHGGYQLNGSSMIGESLLIEQFCMDGAYLAYFFAAGSKKNFEYLYSKLKETYREKGYWRNSSISDDEYDYYGQNWVWLSLNLIKENLENSNLK